MKLKATFLAYLAASAMALGVPTSILQLVIPTGGSGNPNGSEEVQSGATLTIDAGAFIVNNGTAAGFIGSGTVSSFSAGTLSPLFTTSVANPTSLPALTFAASNAAQNSVLAGPASGGAGAYSFQTAPTFSGANLTAVPSNTALYPTFNQSTTGTAAHAPFSGITGITGSPSSSTYLNGAGAWVTPSGAGTVTSVGLALPTIFNVTNSPVTSSGTLTGALANETANTILAAPNGSSGVPTFRALVPTDIPALNYQAASSTLSTLASGNPFTAGTNVTFSGTWPAITISGASSPGTVSSFSAGNLSPLFTTSVANATSTPALTFTISNAAQNSILAGPSSGGAGAPAYQTAPTFSGVNLTALPTTTGLYPVLNQNTSGSAGSVAFSGITGITGSASSTTFLNGSGAWAAPFALTTTGSSGAATFSGGTLNIPSYTGGGGTTGSNILAGNGSGGFTNVTTLPSLLSYSSGTLSYSGTALPVADGGTGLTSATNGTILEGNGTGYNQLVLGTNVVSDIQNTAGGANGFAVLNGSGILPASQGGTSVSSLGSNVATALGTAANAANGFVQVATGPAYPAISGANITSLSPANLSAGTISTAQTFTGGAKIGSSGTSLTNLVLVSQTLASGAVTVSDATVSSSTHFFPVSESSGVTGALRLSITPGTGYTVTSSVAIDAGAIELLRIN